MKLPLLNTREFAKIINKIGFNCKRQEGSQVFWGYVEGRATVVLNPGGEEIDRGLLNKIIKYDLRISRESFMKNV